MASPGRSTTGAAAANLLTLNVSGTTFTVRREVLVQVVPTWVPSAVAPPSPIISPLEGPQAAPTSRRQQPSSHPAGEAVLPTLNPCPGSGSPSLSLAPTMLGAMFSGRWEGGLPRDELRRPFLELEPTCFRQLVNWLVALYRPAIKGGCLATEERSAAGGQLEPIPGGPGPGPERREEPAGDRQPGWRDLHAGAAAAAAAVSGADTAEGPRGEGCRGAGSFEETECTAELLLRALAAAGVPPAPPPPSDVGLLTTHLEMLRYLGMPLPYVPPPPAPPPPPPAAPPMTRCLGPAVFHLLVDRAVWVHGCKRPSLERWSSNGERMTHGSFSWLNADTATARAAGAAGMTAVSFRLTGHEEVVRGSGGAWILAPFRVVPYDGSGSGGAADSGAGNGSDPVAPVAAAATATAATSNCSSMNGAAARGCGGGGLSGVEGAVYGSTCWRCGAQQPVPIVCSTGGGARGQGLMARTAVLDADRAATAAAAAAAAQRPPLSLAPLATAVPPAAAGRYLIVKLRLAEGAAVGILLGPPAEVAARCGKYGVTSPAEHGAFFGWDSAADLPAAPPPIMLPSPSLAVAAASPPLPVATSAFRSPPATPLRSYGGASGGSGSGGGGAAEGAIGSGNGAGGGMVISCDSPLLTAATAAVLGADGCCCTQLRSPATAVAVGAAAIRGRATPLVLTATPPPGGSPPRLPPPTSPSQQPVRPFNPAAAIERSSPSFVPSAVTPPLYDIQREIVLGLDAATSRLLLYGSGGRHRLLSMALPDGAGEGAVAVFLRSSGQVAEVMGEAAVTAADYRAVRVPAAGDVAE
ncbi:hypothetical protein VOLCADRAFT_90018 [Volvox carteri f. nagariensis]|uniref:Potassium channel tetramerisation-type BTB domain-containing protein n=1 Tax=Volvox carteri f. nagariensis TaxID=3068 RepID=D8TT99_VOLCA|nr:uncharacterized protein VOLCADRAFT_90018 [Volvox carteri f. nagariensis]EFJ49270.1 hypothetical protein VOLCADRAFT_90018 [Volvox carteri f. nagariensis]|eukprot:XP_002949718.1 hypothetical protein VOLCADRAFT_90018 [Volvox carteri f. nagariensis]